MNEFPRGYRQKNALDPRAVSGEDSRSSLAAFQKLQEAKRRTVREFGRASSIEEFRAALDPLIKASRQAGRVFTPKARAKADTGGQEHDVLLGPERTLKFTHPNTSGKVLVFKNGAVYLANGDPADYFERIQLQNSIFGDDVQVEGVEKDGTQYSIVISQPTLTGVAPTRKEIESALSEAGFKRVGPTEYYREGDEILIGDAHEGNLVKTEKGVVPIDVTIQKPAGDLRRWAQDSRYRDDE